MMAEKDRSVSEEENDIVILSLCGWQEKHAHNVSLVNSMQTEQLKCELPNAIVYHVVLDKQSDLQEHHMIGSQPPLGFPRNTKPKEEWLNWYAGSFYSHLRSRVPDVTHIVAHAPYFAWGAIEIRKMYYPEAKITLVMHAYTECDSPDEESECEDYLDQWLRYVHKIVSVGDTIHQDLLSRLGEDKEKLVCYSPEAPTAYRNVTWVSPKGNKNVVIFDSQKNEKIESVGHHIHSDFNVNMAIDALSKIAEDLRKTGKLKGKLTVYVLPSDAKERYRLQRHTCIDLKFVDASSTEKLVQYLKKSMLCILPLHCSSWSFCVKALIPLAVGLPTLVNKSAGVVSMLETICKDQSESFQQYVDDIGVDVTSVKSDTEELEAWQDAITKKLVNEESAVNTARKVKDLLCGSQTRNPEFVNILKEGWTKRLNRASDYHLPGRRYILSKNPQFKTLPPTQEYKWKMECGTTNIGPQDTTIAAACNVPQSAVQESQAKTFGKGAWHQDKAAAVMLPVPSPIQPAQHGQHNTASTIQPAQHGQHNTASTIQPAQYGQHNARFTSDSLSTIIRQNYVAIVNNLEVDRVCDHLLQQNILNYEHLENIEAMNTKTKKARTLLDILRRRPDAKAKVCFYQALLETDHPSLAKFFEE